MSKCFLIRNNCARFLLPSPFSYYRSLPSCSKTFSVAKPGKIQPLNLKKKKRLDEICLERFQQYSRTFIQSWILQGKVLVDGKVVNKAGTPIPDKAVVEIMAEIPKYVCRAGFKLEAAIEQLDVDVAGKVALDSGLSTGGFTDCLLQHGASFVYGIDVGYGQVADKIRRDERVCVMERTNLRYLTALPQKVDLVTLDLSFISILLVMPAVVNVMKETSTLVTLVKPQFEARRSQDDAFLGEFLRPFSNHCYNLSAQVPNQNIQPQNRGQIDKVGGGGIVRDPEVHREIEGGRRPMMILAREEED